MWVSGPAKIHMATLADLAAIPEEDRRHEIIDGELVPKKAATFRHGFSQARLITKLGPFNRRPGAKSPGGWWFSAEAEIQLAEHQIYRPDFAGWRRERMEVPPTEWPISLAPDWVCEVLSTNKRNDLVRKKRGYHRGHVGHYWIIDPDEQTLSVMRWSPDGYVEVIAADRDEAVRAEPFDAIELKVGVLFGDDDDEP
jgi:Uma2 family endonuclease